MGTYTQIASLGRFSAANQRSRGPRLGTPARDERGEEAAPFFCPSCGDGSVVVAECGRCGVQMHPSAGAIVLPRRHDGRDASRRSLGIAGFALMTAFGGPAVLLAALGVMDEAQYGRDASANLTWAAMLAGGGAFVLLIVALLTFGPSLFARLRERARRIGARRRAKNSARHQAAALPARTDTPVRLRGRVGLADERLVVEDETGRVTVRLGPQVRVYDERGERTVLGEGEEIEIVGVGQRTRGAGHGYRDAMGDFAFDADRPLEIWVR